MQEVPEVRVEEALNVPGEIPLAAHAAGAFTLALFVVAMACGFAFVG